MIKIIFMGSPDFALPSLQLLHANNDVEIVHVYSQPAKPAGRGKKDRPTDVDLYCQLHNLPIRTPKSLRAPEELEFFTALDCDIVVVVAYGLLIPASYLCLPSMGFLNLHPSDLPKYRGAAPLQWTLLNGEETSAICIMQLDVGMDSGDILLCKEFAVNDMNFVELHEYCKNEGAQMLLEVVLNYHNYRAIKQNHNNATFAPKITKEMAQISAIDNVQAAINKSRALNPSPGTYIIDNNLSIKIMDISGTYQKEFEYMPGSFIILKDQVRYYLQDGYITIGKLQKPGKNFISAKDFINSSK